MPLDEYLENGEVILGRAGNGSMKFYATDRRVIRHVKGWFNEEFDEVPYDRVSLTLNSRSYWRAMVTGILLMILGLILHETITIFDGNLGIIITIVIGAPLFVFGLYFTGAWYEIRDVGRGETSKVWKLKNVEPEDIREFGRVIREMSSS